MVYLSRGCMVASMLAASLWLGGIVALGAVVAPVVFRVVPAPTNADAMTLVFRRFDAVAVGCAVVVMVAEAARASAEHARLGVSGVIRVGAALAGSALAAWQAFDLAPKIEALHRSGAVRGVGAAGAELDAAHRLAESEAKAQVAFVAVFLVASVLSLASQARDHTEERRAERR
jgi:uncharacterized membrane protein